MNNTDLQEYRNTELDEELMLLTNELVMIKVLNGNIRLLKKFE